MSVMVPARVGIGKLGDWFAPDCTIGDPNCVPHWYCYIPGAVTPDCLASLKVGTQQVVGGVTSAVVGTAGAVAGGAASGVGQGICQQLFGTGDMATKICTNPAASLAIGLGIVVGLAYLFKGK